MYTENGLVANLDEVRKVIDTADVFTIGFPLFPERLLVDARSQSDQGPLIRIVGPVSSLPERFFELGRLRPQFSVPQRFMFFIWPHSVHFLEESGIFVRIQQRCATNEHGVVTTTMCDEAIEALNGFERQAIVAAIRGENHNTIWEASGSPF
ncbi:MAG: hypothetical protein ACR2PL_03060 [Dehalococcoidia bacterium]